MSSILSFTGASRPAARPARTCHSAAAVVSLASAVEPTESRVKIGGMPYKVQTWTSSQWAATPAEDRPAVAWCHGDGMAAIAPDW